ncbi:MAG: S41 family peptidase [Candidatus Kapaibacterium sp.]
MKIIKKINKKSIFIFVIILLIGSIAWKLPDNVDYIRIAKVTETFASVYREVSLRFIDTINHEDFIVTGIKSMLKTLDPYTTYIDKNDKNELDLLLQNQYGGAGISVFARDSSLFINELLDNYPAKKVGLRIGDKIISINDINLQNSTVEKMREVIRGTPGGVLKFVIKRGAIPQPISYSLIRELIQAKSISYSGLLNDSTGYIKLTRFSQGAPLEFKSALKELQVKNSISSLVIDLRDNGGGLLESAVSIASNFVPKGSLIVSTKGRDTNDVKYIYTEEVPILKNVKIAVLINKNSASASEILAGAIQDLDAGVILGQPSFGKGLVQTLHWIGQNIQLKITTARYYTPSGRCIQKYTYDKSGKAIITNDSIQHEFLTTSGRNVKSSGGILPDSILAVDTSSFVSQLNRSWVFFDYATLLTSNMNSIPIDFKISNDIANSFFKYVISLPSNKLPDNFVYKKVKEFETFAKDKNVSNLIINSISEIKNESIKNINLSLNSNKDNISRYILREVYSRFNGTKDRVQLGLIDDNQLQSTIIFLQSKVNYYSMLHKDIKQD